MTAITVFPEGRVLDRDARQQLVVLARYSNGTVENVTRRAQYESNDTEIAVVDADGLVRTLALSGEAAIMVRYQSKVAVFRATVPLGVKVPVRVVLTRDDPSPAATRVGLEANPNTPVVVSVSDTWAVALPWFRMPVLKLPVEP